MMANGALVVLAVICTWLVYDVTAGQKGPRTGYPQVPESRSAFPALQGDESSRNKGLGNNNNNNGRPRNTFDRPQDLTGAGGRQTRRDDGLPRAGGAGFGKGNRRYRRDFSGNGYRGFYPGVPAWGGYGGGAPGGDYGQDFGYGSDNWRST